MTIDAATAQALLDAAGGEDHEDHFPWGWAAWLDDEGNPLAIGSVHTPNGQRPDGSMHTYRSVAVDVHINTAR